MKSSTFLVVVLLLAVWRLQASDGLSIVMRPDLGAGTNTVTLPSTPWQGQTQWSDGILWYGNSTGYGDSNNVAFVTRTGARSNENWEKTWVGQRIMAAEPGKDDCLVALGLETKGVKTFEKISIGGTVLAEQSTPIVAVEGMRELGGSWWVCGTIGVSPGFP